MHGTSLVKLPRRIDISTCGPWMYPTNSQITMLATLTPASRSMPLSSSASLYYHCSRVPMRAWSLVPKSTHTLIEINVRSSRRPFLWWMAVTCLACRHSDTFDSQAISFAMADDASVAFVKACPLTKRSWNKARLLSKEAVHQPQDSCSAPPFRPGFSLHWAGLMAQSLKHATLEYFHLKCLLLVSMKFNLVKMRVHHLQAQALLCTAIAAGLHHRSDAVCVIDTDL